MTELPLGQRVFLFCSRMRAPAEQVERELAELEAELEASALAPEEVAKLERMLRLHAARLRGA
ncbi:MAG: hypothetical protein KDD82_22560 [Planctomycetes bacterium]|nr:hypothetical protein [Planctomycetota bacterium]